LQQALATTELVQLHNVLSVIILMKHLVNQMMTNLVPQTVLKQLLIVRQPIMQQKVNVVPMAFV
jgi:hypothetical protein